MSTDAAPAIRADGTVLGFDVGARRIGVAVGSALRGQRLIAGRRAGALTLYSEPL